MRKFLIGLCALLLFAPAASAREVAGAQIPEILTLEGRKLSLQGTAIRKKFFVKVYVGALYTTHPMTTGRDVILANEPMVLRMHFIRAGVSPETLRDSWIESITTTLGTAAGSVRGKIKQFANAFTHETREGDDYDIVYLPDKGLEVRYNGQVTTAIEGLLFKGVVFGIWFGDPPFKELASMKNGLLGK
ncbi:MAG: chalcone isomerase family protein [Proteobacteria bacterium]|nr:chalcone isomerase family protein [Pseudomonadota bacterium]